MKTNVKAVPAGVKSCQGR